LQLLPGVVDFQAKHVGHITTGSDFQGDFIARDAKAAGAGRFGTTGLSQVFDFATAMNRLQRRMMVKKLMMIAALIVYASPALAGSYTSTWGCRYSRFYGFSNCRSTWTKIPDPVRDPEQERQDATTQQKEDEKWAAFCKPTFRADEYGVRRAAYAKQGCEFGRSE
jgi:hypothetical protein